MCEPDRELDRDQAEWYAETAAKLLEMHESGVVFAAVSMTSWQVLGTLSAADAGKVFATEFGPERGVDLGRKYEGGKLGWRSEPRFIDGKVHALPAKVGATYLYRTLSSPSAREVGVSLGSDDGIKLWLNGKELLSHDIPRGVAPDQERVKLALDKGVNKLLIKIANTGGAAGFYFRKDEESFLGFSGEFARLFLRGADQRSSEQERMVMAYYRREHSVDWRAAAKEIEQLREQRAAIEKSAPVSKTLRNRSVRELSTRLGPALLLHSDLDHRVGRILADPADLTEMAVHLAFDLRNLGHHKKRVDRLLPAMPTFGKLRVRGVAGPVGTDGWQLLTLTVSKDGASSRRGSTQGPLVGRFEIVRQFDAERGLVVGFESSFTGEMYFAGRPDTQVQRASFLLRDEWKLRAVTGRGAAFNARVAEAIRKGAAFLEGKINADLNRVFPAAPDKGGQTRKSGELALILLTLIKAGGSPQDPPIAKALAELRRREIRDTYSLGVALMAMEACYTPPNERTDLLNGLIDAPRQRIPSPEDKACMKRWVVRLLDNRDQRNRDHLARWNYVPGRRFDNSLSQYALLGLYAAQLCGIEIDPSIWPKAARSFLDQQRKDGERIGLDLVEHDQLTEKTARRRTVSSVQPAGWAYSGRGNNTGSMTTAGIASLLICDAAMGKRRPSEVSHARLLAATRAGFAWLARNYQVRSNPGAGSSWLYYYLYGLERACELAQVAHLQGCDWYFDGATWLIEQQGGNGAFLSSSAPDVCFAILFLKKAALPVFTGR